VPRVLVAEDDQRIRTVLERFLELAGHDVQACENGKLALEAYDIAAQAGGAAVFDLVVTDINMPVMMGDELLRELKGRSPGLPVIVLTARSDAATITACFKSDAYRYLVKPFTREDLENVVDAALCEAESGALEARESAVEEDPEGWVELSGPSRQEYVDRFQDFCDKLIASRLDEQAKNELKIAVQELGQNAIEWGNRMKMERKIRLSYKLLDDRILIRIADEGTGFNPEVIPDPTIDPIKLIEAREARGKRPGGFGIHLARRVMDTVSYNERGNMVTMEKRFGD
jgi:CheY-like chemotaxis protein